jgi:hypothetical protein
MTNQRIVSRHMLSTQNLVAKSPMIGYDWPANDTTTRNYFLLAIYLGSYSDMAMRSNRLSTEPELASAFSTVRPANEAPTRASQLNQR